MWLGTRRAMQLSLAGGTLAAFVMAFAGSEPGGGGAVLAAPSPLSLVKAPGTHFLAGFDPLEHELRGRQVVARLPEGRTAELSLESGLQAHVEAILRRYEVPYGALAAMDPRDGRLLAYVSHSSANPAAGDLVRDPTPPAASVFKVITASALVDRGVQASDSVCYAGGFRKLYSRDLEDNRARDRRCATLTEAMGGSINTVFAKLADRRLDRKTLRRYAGAFGFGHALPFDAVTQPSPTEVPGARLEFARTAAGFWHNHMSPLHAALIAATIANDGVMPRPSMVDRVVDSEGKVLHRRDTAPFRSVIPRSTAQVVGKMMRRTVSHGTARSAFFDQAGNAFLPGISVAGKTGSLSAERPYRAYSWWVGFAPADKPEIAVAALVVNTPKWRIKGSFLAREALRHQLVVRPAELAREARARRKERAAAEAAAKSAKAAKAAKSAQAAKATRPAPPEGVQPPAP